MWGSVEERVKGGVRSVKWGVGEWETAGTSPESLLRPICNLTSHPLAKDFSRKPMSSIPSPWSYVSSAIHRVALGQ